MDPKKKISPENTGEEKFPGYPQYPEKEDIYSREQKERLDEETGETPLKKQARKNRLPGVDMEVPGSELDDKNEAIGEEDEENNYYSLGGENHEDLEEDRS